MKNLYYIVEESENLTRYLWDGSGLTYFNMKHKTLYTNKHKAEQRAKYAAKYCVMDETCKVYVKQY